MPVRESERSVFGFNCTARFVVGIARMKRERFEREAAKMKQKYEMPPAEKSAIAKEEAFRLGYTAGAAGIIRTRDDCPLQDPILRRRWREGFDLGHGKGLKIALPSMARRSA